MSWHVRQAEVQEDHVFIMYLITEIVELLTKNLFTYHFHSSYVKITSSQLQILVHYLPNGACMYVIGQRSVFDESRHILLQQKFNTLKNTFENTLSKRMIEVQQHFFIQSRCIGLENLASVPEDIYNSNSLPLNYTIYSFSFLCFSAIL